MTHPRGTTGEHGDRATIWIVAAGALHAAVFVALAFLPVRGAAHPPAVDAPSEIEVAVETATTTTAAPPAPSPAPEATAAPASAGLAPTMAAAAIASSRAGVREGAPAASSEVAAAEATSGTPGGERPPSPPLTPEQLGLGGIGKSNPFLPRRAEPEASLDKPRRERLRGTGLEHDTQLGLGPEGPALGALSDGTRMSIAPLEGRAIFLVRSDRDGLVSSIDLLDSAGGTGWLEAGKLAFEALKAKRFRVPTGANGLAMRIEVTSGMKLPNGQDAPVGTRRGAGGMPELTIPDVSNIGAAPRRVVKSRIVSTEAL
ncbi:MAG: hypothetical protein JWP97_1695 [Labilithrix sp.]|nr:hypothetical protein [Labilithrix sp.]